MTSKRKPTTNEELKADIEGTPNRGSIGDVPVIRLEQDELRVKISKELHREFLIWAGVNGFGSKADALEFAIVALLNSPGVQTRTSLVLKSKAEAHNVSEAEIRNAILGQFKKIARLNRAKLQGIELDVEQDPRLDAVIDRALPVDSMPIETKDYGLRDDGRS